jgi:hypothetical protein
MKLGNSRDLALRPIDAQVVATYQNLKTPSHQQYIDLRYVAELLPTNLPPVPSLVSYKFLRSRDMPVTESAGLSTAFEDC